MFMSSNYNIFINLISLNCELFLLLCLIIYTIYMCFFYFNSFYTYTYSLLFVYVYSFVLLIFLICNIEPNISSIFGGSFYINYNDIMVRNLVVILSFPLIYITINYFLVTYSLVNLLEYTLLLYILVLATCLVLYCNDIISLFLCIELQSMSIYILICLRGSFSYISIGIRYFIMGTIVSLLFLFSFTLFYYFTGLSSFIDFLYISTFYNNSIIIYITMLIYILFLFKLYVYPFHFLGGDLYRYSPLYILIFLSSILYYVYLYIFVKLISYIYTDVTILLILLYVTLFMGVLNILSQRDIRAFLGFSTSIHSGFILYIIIMDIYVNVYACLFYALIYIFSIVGILMFIYKFVSVSIIDHKSKAYHLFNDSFISCIRDSKVKSTALEFLSSWSGISKHYKIVAFILSILFWSISGLPPFSGFFVKFYVLILCYNLNNFLIVMFFITISIISSLYYIKVIKEYYYVIKFKTYFLYFYDFDLLFIFCAIIVCLISVFLPELLIYYNY